MKKILLLIGFLFSTAAGAADDAAKVLDKLKATYPNTQFSAIDNTPFDGIYEVTMGNNIVYTDRNAQFFFFGHIFDMKNQVDVTAEKKQALASTSAPTTEKKVVFPRALLSNAIRTVKGSGEREIAVFSDPDCPYCKTLETELSALDNVTIYTFLYPLENLHREAKVRSISIWCAPDRNKAWQDYMLLGITPSLLACHNPIDDNLVLGSALGVVGTPTLIAADGRVLPGAATAKMINDWLGVK